MRGLVKRFQTLSFVPDWILLKQAKLGDKEAFGRLYEKYLDRVYRYIFYRVGQNAQLAEDLVQTTFLRAWEKLETFDTGSFQAWIYTIARNLLIDHIRSHKQQEQLDETVADERQDVQEHVLVKIQAETILAHMQYLTEEQQEIIMMRFVNELSYKEIAQALDKREDAIRAMQYRALKELKRRLGYEG